MRDFLLYKSIAFVSLILGICLPAWGHEYPPNAPHSAEIYDERVRCAKLLNRQAEDSTVERSTQTLVQVLLMLIYEHPLLVDEKFQNERSSREDFALFHASAGFAIRPRFPRRMNITDPTFYNKIVHRKAFNWNIDSRFSLLQETLNDIRDGIRSGEDLYNSNLLYNILRHQWRSFATPPNSKTRPQNPSEKVRLPTDLIPAQLLPLPGDPLVYPFGFAGISQVQVHGLLKLSADMDDENVQKRFHEFLRGPGLREVLMARDKIVWAAFDEGWTLNSAVNYPTEQRWALRKKILELLDTPPDSNTRLVAYGTPSRVHPGKPDPSHLSHPAPFLGAPILNLGHDPRPAPVDSEFLKLAATTAGDRNVETLTAARLALQAIDHAIGLVPTRSKTIPAIERLQTETAVARSIESLLVELGRLAEKANISSENLDVLMSESSDLQAAILDRLESYSAELDASKTSENLQRTKLAQAETIRAVLLQSVRTLNDLYNRELTWLNYVTQVEALARIYRNQRSLGKDTEDAAANLLTSLRQFSQFASFAPTENDLRKSRHPIR